MLCLCFLVLEAELKTIAKQRVAVMDALYKRGSLELPRTVPVLPCTGGGTENSGKRDRLSRTHCILCQHDVLEPATAVSVLPCTGGRTANTSKTETGCHGRTVLSAAKHDSLEPARAVSVLACTGGGTERSLNIEWLSWTVCIFSVAPWGQSCVRACLYWGRN